MAGYTLAASGTPQFAGAIFGNGYFANGGRYAYISDVTNGAGTWTIEWWAEVVNGGGAVYWINTPSASSANQVRFGLTSTNYITWQVGTAVSNSFGAAPATVGWHHWALTWQSGRYRFYEDGVQFSTGAGYAAVALTWTGGFAVTSQGTGGIDELRISTTNRYPNGTTFTPASSAFTVDGTTMALYHFETDGTDGDTGEGATTYTTNGSSASTVTTTGGSTATFLTAATDTANVSASGSANLLATVTGSDEILLATTGYTTMIMTVMGNDGVVVASTGSSSMTAVVGGNDGVVVGSSNGNADTSIITMADGTAMVMIITSGIVEVAEQSGIAYYNGVRVDSLRYGSVPIVTIYLGTKRVG